MSVEFEWDPAKATGNAEKHRVTCDEAVTVFGDPLARIFDDPDHSEAGPREIIIGHSGQQRVLLVSFTERDGNLRIISARQVTKRGREDYEEHTA